MFCGPACNLPWSMAHLYWKGMCIELCGKEKLCKNEPALVLPFVLLRLVILAKVWSLVYGGVARPCWGLQLLLCSWCCLPGGPSVFTFSWVLYADCFPAHWFFPQSLSFCCWGHLLCFLFINCTSIWIFLIFALVSSYILLTVKFTIPFISSCVLLAACVIISFSSVFNLWIIREVMCVGNPCWCFRVLIFLHSLWWDSALFTRIVEVFWMNPSVNSQCSALTSREHSMWAWCMLVPNGQTWLG